MKIDLITKEEFDSFKDEITLNFTKLLDDKLTGSLSPMLRTKDVCKILKISPSSLQNLRNNGQLPARKMQGTLIYSREDIKQFIESLPQG